MKLYALWGYWKVPIVEQDRDNSTFTTHMGTYRYYRITFRLRNAPETFQCALHLIISGVLWGMFLVYIDNVIVLSSSEEDHFDHLDHILSLLG